MRTSIRLVAIVAAVAASVSCGKVVRDGRAPVLMTVNSITGGTPPSSFLLSDVIRMRTSPAPCSAQSPCPTIVNDPGSAVIGVQMKDSLVAPTANNQVTLTRYHIDYRRTDGRNQQGVDVPYSVDGGVNGVIAANQFATVAFELVRHSAKEESPLVQLGVGNGIINTIATVTFYGTDAVGNVVSASGNISINFGNFADQ